MEYRQQNSTSYHMGILMVDSIDHITPKTGLTLTVTLSKNLGAFVAASGAVTEVGNGWYKLAANAADRDTLGTLIVRASGTDADIFDSAYTIVPWDIFDATNLGLSRLDAAITSRSSHTADDVYQVINASGYTPERAVGLDNLDATISSRSSHNQYDVFAVVSASGYTSSRAARLDYLDSDISSVPSGVWYYPTRTLTSTTVAGTHLVTITTEDEDSNIVGGATVEARTTSGGLLWLGTTNASTGQIVLNLDDGDYYFYAYKHGSVVFSNPTAHSVSGTMAFTMTGSRISAPVPTGSGTCRVYAFVEDIELNPKTDIEMVVYPSGEAVDGFVYTQRPVRSLSDDTGYVYADIVAGLNYKVSIPKANVTRYFTAPASGSVDVATL